MLGFSAFKRKPRQFSYQPRFYDPEKELRDQRRRELLGDDAEEAPEVKKKYVPGSYIRASRMRRMLPETVKEKKQKMSVAAVRFVIAVVLLLLLAYVILNLNLTGFTQMLSK